MHVHFHMVHKVSFARKLFFTLVAIASNCQISVPKILLTYMCTSFIWFPRVSFRIVTVAFREEVTLVEENFVVEEVFLFCV